MTLSLLVKSRLLWAAQAPHFKKRINRFPIAGVTVSLLLLTFFTYLPVLRNSFVHFDDHVFITENKHVQSGLTRESILWAFTSMEDSNWFPLTRLSHLLDVQLFGLSPSGHHLVSLLLHIANTGMLFLLLHAATAARWRSAFAAALFALHPLRVESVAWASERKDVLCVFLCLTTIAAYGRYVRQPTLARWAAVFGATACSLMAKPLAVTLPAGLLLIDVWPLGRWRKDGPGWQRLLIEKFPLVILAGISSAITLRAQQETIAGIGLLSIVMRMKNSIMAYGHYLEKTFWPSNLSALYFFHSQRATPWEVAAVGAGLITLTILALLAAHRRPWFFVGWLWFLGVLVPMIGIVQTGLQSYADRYSYLPHIGIFVALAWGAGDLAASRPRSISLLIPVSVAALVSLSFLSFAQARVWRDTVTLFTRALEVEPDNLMAEMYLARALQQDGRLLEADEHFLHLLEINPGQPGAHLQLGINAFKRGDATTATKHLTAELQNNPSELAAHFYLARTREQIGRDDEARGHYSAIILQDPFSYSGRKGLGLLLGRAGDWRGALEHLRIAQTLVPGDRQLSFLIADAEQHLGLRK